MRSACTRKMRMGPRKRSQRQARQRSCRWVCVPKTMPMQVKQHVDSHGAATTARPARTDLWARSGPDRTAELPQHCVLVLQHRQLGVLGGVPVRHYRQHAQQLKGGSVQQRDDHPRSIRTTDRSTGRAPTCSAGFTSRTGSANACRFPGDFPWRLAVGRRIARCLDDRRILRGLPAVRHGFAFSAIIATTTEGAKWQKL